MTTPLPIETERKFLLVPTADAEANFVGYPCARITQGYLAFEGTECRIRLADKYAPKVTFKQGSGLERVELEFVVDDDVGAQLMQLAQPYVITKRRYDVRGWEIDFFDDGVSEPIAEFEYPGAPFELDRAMTYGLGIDWRREVTGDPAYLNRNIALRVGALAQGAAGYHLRHIPKGMLGQVSKIREELEELEDATIQKIKVLQQVEASDLYGALERFADTLGLTMADLDAMSKATRRAFETGAR